MVRPEGTQDGGLVPTIKQSAAEAAPRGAPEETQGEKARDPALR